MKVSDTTAAGVATATGAGGVVAAACCCVLPLALAGVGVGATGLAKLGPLHAPFSAVALVAVITGWFLYSRRKRACAARADCAPPSSVTLSLLIAASAFVVLSASWPFIEARLVDMLGG